MKRLLAALALPVLVLAGVAIYLPVPPGVEVLPPGRARRPHGEPVRAGHAPPAPGSVTVSGRTAAGVPPLTRRTTSSNVAASRARPQDLLQQAVAELDRRQREVPEPYGVVGADEHDDTALDPVHQRADRHVQRQNHANAGAPARDTSRTACTTGTYFSRTPRLISSAGRRRRPARRPGSPYSGVPWIAPGREATPRRRPRVPR